MYICSPFFFRPIIHAQARNAVATLTKNDSTKLLMRQAVHTLNTSYESLQVIRAEMQRFASLLPEYPVVMSMKGAGQVTGPQLMAEIGDVRRFTHKGALVAFAGVDAPPFQSGDFEAKSRLVPLLKLICRFAQFLPTAHPERYRSCCP